MTKKTLIPKRVISKRKILTLFVVVTMLVFSSLTFPADQKANSSDQPNGCGTKDFKVPDKPLGNDFKSSCDNHDRCYATKDNSKKDCDTEFKNDMSNVCKEKKGIDRVGCEVSKFIYHTGVKLGGNDAYDKAQGKEESEREKKLKELKEKISYRRSKW